MEPCWFPPAVGCGLKSGLCWGCPWGSQPSIQWCSCWTRCRGPRWRGDFHAEPVAESREYFDLTYQLLDIVFALVPVLLVIYFLTDQRQTARASSTWQSAFQKLGFNFARPGRDLLQGVGLAALIGIPSLGLYAAGRALGITTAIIPSALDAHWWTIPV